MNFNIQGPFELKKHKGEVFSTAEIRKEFWDMVNDSVSGLPNLRGCYVFALNNSKGMQPWYVGKSEMQPFIQECSDSHKINHFNAAINNKRGRPYLFFIPLLTPKGEFSKFKKSPNNPISKLETMLIDMALSKNPELRNLKDTMMLRKLKVAGFLNDKKAKSGSAKQFRDMFGS